MMNEMYDEKQKEALIKSLGVFELRGLAREFGVPSPTTKKRDELISMILKKMKEGNSLDLQGQKRGRPFKKLASLTELVSNVLPDKNEKFSSYDTVITFMQEDRPLVNNLADIMDEFEGVVKEEKEGYSLVDIKRNVKVFIPPQFEKYDLLEIGMYIKVEAGKISGTESYLALVLKEIDGKPFKDYTSSTFDKGEEVISNESIPFAPGLAKQGRRNIYCYDEDLYENRRFEDLYKFCLDKNYKMIVLNVNSSYENQIMFKNLGVKYNFTTLYGEKSFWSLHKVVDVINYAQHSIDRGEKVVVFIPDIMTTLRKIDENFFEDESTYGYKQQTIFIIQKLFALGRVYKNGCSGTLIFGYNELDKEDKFLNNDILRISKKI